MDRRLRRAPHQNGRELHALAALVMWLACFEAAPLLHTAGHGALAPHIHGDTSVSFAGAEGERRCHDGHCHVEARPAGGVSATHGDHELLHRGLAVTTPPPAVPPVASAPCRTVRRAHERPRAPTVEPVLPARARAPPHSSVSSV